MKTMEAKSVVLLHHHLKVLNRTGFDRDSRALIHAA